MNEIINKIYDVNMCAKYCEMIIIMTRNDFVLQPITESNKVSSKNVNIFPSNEFRLLIFIIDVCCCYRISLAIFFVCSVFI